MSVDLDPDISLDSEIRADKLIRNFTSGITKKYACIILLWVLAN